MPSTKYDNSSAPLLMTQLQRLSGYPVKNDRVRIHFPAGCDQTEKLQNIFDEMRESERESWIVKLLDILFEPESQRRRRELNHLFGVEFASLINVDLRVYVSWSQGRMDILTPYIIGSNTMYAQVCKISAGNKALERLCERTRRQGTVKVKIAEAMPNYLMLI